MIEVPIATPVYGGYFEEPLRPLKRTLVYYLGGRGLHFSLS